MSQPSRIVPEDLKQDTNKSLFCICCMKPTGTFIRLASCTHKEYLESFPITDLNLDIPVVVCSKCHDKLKTATQFKEQVQNSFNIYLKKANSSEKIEIPQPNLEKSDTLHCNIERIDQFTNTENVSDSSRKYKNISTALGIINSNAASMAALTSSQNFIGLTETLLQATTLGLNLPLMRETVLPEMNKHNSRATLTVNNTTDVLPVDTNKDLERQVNLNKSNNNPVSNKMKILKRTKNESVIEIVHETVCNNVSLIKNDDEDLVLSVDKNKAQETGNGNTVFLKDNNKLPDTDDILERHKIKSENIEMEIEEIKNEPDLEIVHEKLRKPAVVAIHFEDKTTASPINIKKEPEATDPLSANNENHYEEIFVKPEIQEETDDVGIVGAYGTAVLPDVIKFEPEEVEDSYMDSDTSTEADSSGHKKINDYIVPIIRTLTKRGDEELMKEPGQNLHSTDCLKWKYPCNHCSIGFQYKENLIDHVKRKHATAAINPPKRYLICDVCQQVVPATDFKEHQLTHYNREEQLELKRKRNCERQRAYYHRQKDLKNEGKKKTGPKSNAERQREFRRRKAEKSFVDLKRKKLDSNEENVVHCRAVENIENVTLQKNQFLSQQLQIYEQRNECITPEVILHRNTGIPGDGNCLFHSLISVLQLKIETSDLRNQLRDSPYLNFCHNPQEAYKILSSTNDYGDLDCLYLFSKMYNQNVCVHYSFYNITTKNQDTIFCHFKANDTQKWIHLHLREQHFTPFHEVSDLLETKQDATQNEAHVDANIKLLRDNSDEGPTQDNHNKHENEIEIDREDRIGENIMDFIADGTIPVYTNYRKHSKSHIDFYKDFTSNSFGHSCIVCDRLWWKRDLKMSTTKHESILKTILQNHTPGEFVQVCSTCYTSLEKGKIPLMSTYNGFAYPKIPSHLPKLNLIEQPLISPRVPFIQIRRLRHVNGQCGIYGQIINVPVEVNTMVKQLPRNIQDDHCIYVHLEKKLIHKTSNVHGLINMSHIKEWLSYLVH